MYKGKEGKVGVENPSSTVFKNIDLILPIKLSAVGARSDKSGILDVRLVAKSDSINHFPPPFRQVKPVGLRNTAGIVSSLSDLS